MAEPIVEGFSVSHAAVLDGDTGAEEALGDIYGVREGNLDVDTDSFENTGDDAVLSTWDWINFATVGITSGYLSFPLIGLLAASTVTSSGAAPNDYFEVPLWEAESVNAPARPILLRIPSRDKDGVSRVLDVILYKCFFSPITFEGPAYRDGLTVSYTARAVMSDVDEAGDNLAKRAVGRLVSTPSA